jgi:hypothetical protein
VEEEIRRVEEERITVWPGPPPVSAQHDWSQIRFTENKTCSKEKYSFKIEFLDIAVVVK